MRLRFGDFAIMYRMNSQSLQVKRVLHLHGVPSESLTPLTSTSAEKLETSWH